MTEGRLPRWSRLRSLRVQVLLWTILPIIVFVLGLSFVDVYGHQRAMRLMVEERDRALLESVAQRIADSLEHYAGLLQAVGCREALRRGDPEAQARVLATVEEQFTGGIALLDASGAVRVAIGPSDAWVRSPKAGDLARATAASGRPGFLIGPDAGLPEGQLAVAARLLTGDGALVGVLPLHHTAIVEAVDGLQAAHTSSLATPSHPPSGASISRAMLLSGSGRLIYGAGPAPADRASSEQDVVTTITAIPGTDWQLIYSEPWQHLLPIVLRYAQATVLVAVAAVLISLLAVYSAVRYVTAPLQELGQRARRMAWGDFEAVAAPIGGVREIADLQNTLRQMAAQVRSYQAAMRSYVAAMTRGQEEERKRLARELHDDTVQSLIVLGQQVDRIHRAGLRDPEACHGQLALVRQGIRNLVHGIRRMIGDLRPSYLDDLGLVPALEALVQAGSSTYQGELATSGEQRRLPPDVELAIFRIVQEALRNVEQHARARHVSVRLIFEEQGVRVSVEDDGVGFSVPPSPDDLAHKGNFGLLGMRERAMLSGGWLALASMPGKGTKVEAYLPVPPAGPSGA
ncbi:MAG: HAMP domain-containing protein [Anaerolineae bacterium]|nr:HAMP domain-containing protein [Anaerolineae bacterium]